MINAHVAHDCKIGNNVIMVNNASLAGHVILRRLCYNGSFIRCSSVL